MGGGGLDGPGDLGDPGVLGQVAAGARLQRAEDRLIVSVGREDDDLGLGLGSADPPGRLDAVEPRHPQVHQHDMRAMPCGEGHGLLAVGGRGDGLDPRRDLQQRHQPFAHERLIVGDQDPDQVTHDPIPRRPGARPWAGRRGETGTRSSTRQPSPRAPALRCRREPGHVRACPGYRSHRRSRPAGSELAPGRSGGPRRRGRRRGPSRSPACSTTDTLAPGACLRTLVRASWTMRRTDSPDRSGETAEIAVDRQLSGPAGGPVLLDQRLDPGLSGDRFARAGRRPRGASRAVPRAPARGRGPDGS